MSDTESDTESDERNMICDFAHGFVFWLALTVRWLGLTICGLVAIAFSPVWVAVCLAANLKNTQAWKDASKTFEKGLKP